MKPPPSTLRTAWATYRSDILTDMEDPESLQAAGLIFAAGYRAALITIKVLDKPDYAVVRSFMLNEASTECDLFLRPGGPDLKDFG